MNCTICSARMKPLFTSMFCPRGCDELPKAKPVNHMKQSFEYAGINWEVWTGPPPIGNVGKYDGVFILENDTTVDIETTKNKIKQYELWTRGPNDNMAQPNPNHFKANADGYYKYRDCLLFRCK